MLLWDNSNQSDLVNSIDNMIGQPIVYISNCQANQNTEQTKTTVP